MSRKDKKMRVWIDGICEPNPGKMGIGIFFEDGTEISKKLGKGTNNIAEYLSLLHAIEELKKKGIKQAAIHSDSRLLVNQMNGKWKIKSATSKKYVHTIKQKIENYGLRLDIQWIPREDNKKADMLSKKALE